MQRVGFVFFTLPSISFFLFSGGDSSSYLGRSHDSLAQREWRRTDDRKERAGEESREPARRGKEATGSCSVEEEVATAADDSFLSESIHSVLNEKGTRRVGYETLSVTTKCLCDEV